MAKGLVDIHLLGKVSVDDDCRFHAEEPEWSLLLVSEM